MTTKVKMTQNRTKPDEKGYISVRQVKVPAIQINQIEDEFGAKLVEDNEPYLLLALDDTLQKFRRDKGKEPDIVMIKEYPGEFFKHMVINIEFLGLSIPGPYQKPAWFRFKKQYLGHNYNKKGK